LHPPGSRVTRTGLSYPEPVRIWHVAIGVVALGVSILAQAPAPPARANQDLAPPASRLQHATIVASAAATTVSPGQTLALWVDVAPKPGVHLYASGAKGFSPVAIVMTPTVDVSSGRAAFPRSELFRTLGATTPVPVYRKPFRITQPITISRTRAAGSLIVAAAVNYQACDDTLCYPATSAPVLWNLTVR
jgi:DsbC/DsbD-like thiol-disulfide interchange protein